VFFKKILDIKNLAKLPPSPTHPKAKVAEFTREKQNSKIFTVSLKKMVKFRQKKIHCL